MDGTTQAEDGTAPEEMAAKTFHDLVDELRKEFGKRGDTPPFATEALVALAMRIDDLNAIAVRCDRAIDAKLIRLYVTIVGEMERFYAEFSLKRRWKPTALLADLLQVRVDEMLSQIASDSPDKSRPDLVWSQLLQKLVDEIRDEVGRRDRRGVVVLYAARALACAILVRRRADQLAPGEIAVDTPMIKAYYRLWDKIERLATIMVYPDMLIHYPEVKRLIAEQSGERE